MSREARFENFEELLQKVLIEEPHLDLPVIEQDIDTDDEHDMLDSLIYDALLEEDSPPLPVIDPKIVQWIDRLEEYEENEVKLVSDAYLQQEPQKEEERAVEAGRVNEGDIPVKCQQNQLQPKTCDLCYEEFRFPVNIRRHKWRHSDMDEERIIETIRDRFKEYWEKLEDKKARKIFSIKDAVPPANLEKDLRNDIIGDVSSYVEALDTDRQCLELNSVIAFLLKPEEAKECPPYLSICRVLCFLSDSNYFRGTLNLTMQEIVFPDKITMKDIEEQGILASFEFLVEHCMMEAWADDRERMADSLLEEEAAAKKQMQSPASASKTKKSQPSSSKKRKEKPRKQDVSTLNSQQPEDKDDLSKDDEHVSSSQLNQRKFTESKETTAEKSSKYQTEQSSSNAAATQTNLVPGVDNSVQVTTFSLPHQEMATESLESMKLSDLMGDDINVGSSPSRKWISSTSKTKKPSYLQRKKKKQKEAKLMRKHTQGTSLSNQKERDGPWELKQSDSEQSESENDTKDQSSEYNDEQAMVSTQLKLVPNVGNSVQDNISLSLSGENASESSQRMKSGYFLVGEVEVPIPGFSLDDEGSLSGIPHREKSAEGEGKWQTADAGGASKDEKEQDSKGSDENPAHESEGPTDSNTQLQSVPGEGEESGGSSIPKKPEESEIPDEETRGWTLRGAFNFDRSVAEYMQYLRHRWNALQLNDFWIDIDEYERRQDGIFPAQL